MSAWTSPALSGRLQMGMSSRRPRQRSEPQPVQPLRPNTSACALGAGAAVSLCVETATPLT